MVAATSTEADPKMLKFCLKLPMKHRTREATRKPKIRTKVRRALMFLLSFLQIRRSKQKHEAMEQTHKEAPAQEKLNNRTCGIIFPDPSQNVTEKTSVPALYQINNNGLSKSWSYLIHSQLNAAPRQERFEQEDETNGVDIYYNESYFEDDYCQDYRVYEDMSCAGLYQCSKQIQNVDNFELFEPERTQYGELKRSVRNRPMMRRHASMPNLLENMHDLGLQTVLDQHVTTDACSMTGEDYNTSSELKDYHHLISTHPQPGLHITFGNLLDESGIHQDKTNMTNQILDLGQEMFSNVDISLTDLTEACKYLDKLNSCVDTVQGHALVQKSFTSLSPVTIDHSGTVSFESEAIENSEMPSMDPSSCLVLNSCRISPLTEPQLYGDCQMIKHQSDSDILKTEPQLDKLLTELQSDMNCFTKLQSDKNSFTELQLGKNSFTKLQSDNHFITELSDKNSFTELHSDKNNLTKLQSNNFTELQSDFANLLAEHQLIAEGTKYNSKHGTYRTPLNSKPDVQNKSNTARLDLPCSETLITISENHRNKGYRTMSRIQPPVVSCSDQIKPEVKLFHFDSESENYHLQHALSTEPGKSLHRGRSSMITTCDLVNHFTPTLSRRADPLPDVVSSSKRTLSPTHIDYSVGKKKRHLRFRASAKHHNCLSPARTSAMLHNFHSPNKTSGMHLFNSPTTSAMLCNFRSPIRTSGALCNFHSPKRTSRVLHNFHSPKRTSELIYNFHSPNITPVTLHNFPSPFRTSAQIHNFPSPIRTSVMHDNFPVPYRTSAVLHNFHSPIISSRKIYNSPSLVKRDPLIHKSNTKLSTVCLEKNIKNESREHSEDTGIQNIGFKFSSVTTNNPAVVGNNPNIGSDCKSSLRVSAYPESDKRLSFHRVRDKPVIESDNRTLLHYNDPVIATDTRSSIEHTNNPVTDGDTRSSPQHTDNPVTASDIRPTPHDANSLVTSDGLHINSPAIASGPRQVHGESNSSVIYTIRSLLHTNSPVTVNGLRPSLDSNSPVIATNVKASPLDPSSLVIAINPRNSLLTSNNPITTTAPKPPPANTNQISPSSDIRLSGPPSPKDHHLLQKAANFILNRTPHTKDIQQYSNTTGLISYLNSHYLRELAHLSNKNIQSISDFVKAKKESCETFTSDRLTLDNCFSELLVAVLENKSRMASACENFVFENLHDFVTCKDYLHSPPELVFMLLCNRRCCVLGPFGFPLSYEESELEVKRAVCLYIKAQEINSLESFRVKRLMESMIARRGMPQINCKMVQNKSDLTYCGYQYPQVRSQFLDKSASIPDHQCDSALTSYIASAHKKRPDSASSLSQACEFCSQKQLGRRHLLWKLASRCPLRSMERADIRHLVFPNKRKTRLPVRIKLRMTMKTSKDKTLLANVGDKCSHL